MSDIHFFTSEWLFRSQKTSDSLKKPMSKFPILALPFSLYSLHSFATILSLLYSTSTFLPPSSLFCTLFLSLLLFPHSFPIPSPLSILLLDLLPFPYFFPSPLPIPLCIQSYCTSTINPFPFASLHPSPLFLSSTSSLLPSFLPHHSSIQTSQMCELPLWCHNAFHATTKKEIKNVMSSEYCTYIYCKL